MKRWFPKAAIAIVAFVSVQIVLEFIDTSRWLEFHRRINPVFVSSSVGPLNLSKARVREIFGPPTNESSDGNWEIWTYRPGPAPYLFARRVEVDFPTEGEFAGTCSGYQPIFPLNDLLRICGWRIFPQ